MTNTRWETRHERERKLTECVGDLYDVDKFIGVEQSYTIGEEDAPTFLPRDYLINLIKDKLISPISENIIDISRIRVVKNGIQIMCILDNNEHPIPFMISNKQELGFDILNYKNRIERSRKLNDLLK